MMGIIVKICGLKSADDVGMCRELGADILGFVVEYPLAVPWNLSEREAQPLLELVHSPAKSCLVTGGTPEKIIELAKRLKPSFVQLHFKETLADTQLIGEDLKPYNIEVIKAFPMDSADRLRQFGTESVENIVRMLCDTEVFAILVDSRTPGNALDCGIHADLSIFAQVKRLSAKPVFLAGGITPDNAGEIIKTSNAQYIDVMTGVEKSYGIKDRVKVKRLLSEVRTAGAS